MDSGSDLALRWHSEASAVARQQAGGGVRRSLPSALVSFSIAIIIPRPQGGLMEWKKSIKVFKAKLKT